MRVQIQLRIVTDDDTVLSEDVIACFDKGDDQLEEIGLSLDQAKSVLSRYKEHYRTRNLKSYIVGNRRQRQLVVQAARELEMMPTTEGALDLKLDLTHVLDGFSGNEHSFPIVPLYKDVVELVAQSGISYTPTLLVAYGGPFADGDLRRSTGCMSGSPRRCSSSACSWSLPWSPSSFVSS